MKPALVDNSTSAHPVEYRVFSESMGEAWKTARRQLTPRYGIVWRDICLSYAALAAGVAFQWLAGARLPLSWRWALVIPTALWIGYWLHNLVLFMHEAAHFLVHPEKSTNDRLANWLICSFFGQVMATYRHTHWQHHLHLGGPDDTEISYRHAPTIGFIISTLTGYHLLKVVFRWKTLTPATRPDTAEPATTRPDRSKKHRGAAFTAMARFAILHGSVVGLCAWFGRWDVAVGWVFGLLSFFPAFASMRTILEHRSEENVPGKAANCMFPGDPVSRTFGGAGFNRHLLHHWDPQISYTRFDEMEAILLNTSAAPLMDKVRTSYPRRWRRLSGAHADDAQAKRV